MAVVNTKSTIVTNRDAGKNVPLRLSGASVFEAIATVEVAAGDSNNSVFRLFRVNSNASIRSISLLNDAMTGATGYDVGVYAVEADGGAAVDDDLFASALDLSSARTEAEDVTFEALDIDEIEKPLWEQLGLTEDPHVEYDVALTADTVGSAAGTISARLQWVGTV